MPGGGVFHMSLRRESAPQANRVSKEEFMNRVASLAVFLCSDEAAFITGVDYPIDGGFFNLRG